MNSLLFRVARILTLTFIAFLLALLAFDIWYYPSQADRLAQNWTPNATWSVEATHAALAQLGWHAIDLGNLFFVLSLLTFSGVGLALGLFVLWKKSRDPFGLFVSLVFILNAVGIPGHPAEQVFPMLQGVQSFLGGISWQLGFFIYYLFPDGKFVPRWTKWLVPVWLGLDLYSNFLTSDPSFDPITFAGFGFLVSAALSSQIYRYFRYSDAVARQQTKLLMFALMLTAILFPFALSPFVLPGLFLGNGGAGLVWAVIIRLLTTTLFNLLPVAIGFAILRYGLWNIDLIIRRTLIYSLLTVTLALAYFGIVILFQQLFRAFTSAGGDFAIILSTLAIYILFNPFRKRIQDLIDRRFYRRKYDAQKVLAQFAITARDETNLDSLTQELIRVTDETMQPKRVELWLKPKQGEMRRVG